MKKGLVLEGGAMRGMFSAGIIDVFMEEGIEFDGCVGTSAGAIAGCNLKSRQIGRTIRYNVRYCKDPRYAGIRNLIFTGDLYSRDFAYGEIPEKLDRFDKETFEAHPMEFYVVCTDVTTGKPVYHKCTKGDAHDITWMRASASMPIVSRVVDIDGFKLLDGGMSDAIALKFMESVGYDRNVVILTQPGDYIKEPAGGMVALMKVTLGKYPAMIKIAKDRHNMYNETTAYIRRREQEGDTLVIRPEASLNIGKVERDPNELERVYNTGREMGYKRLEEVKAFLGV